MTSGEILDRITERVRGDVVVLTGAGASAAVGLPTMVSFLEKAYGNDILDDLYKGDSYRIGSMDVNERETNSRVILRRLFQAASLGRSSINYDLESFFEFVHNTPMGSNRWGQEEPLKRLLWTFHICQNPGHRQNFKQFSDQYAGYQQKLNMWMDDVHQEIKNLRRRMYEAFLVTPSNLEQIEFARRVYSVLQGFVDVNHIPIFTLNFDTVLESLDQSGNSPFTVVDGVSQNGRIRHFEFAHFLDDHDNQKKCIYLFKMHGSVTWVREGASIRDTYPDEPTSDQGDGVAIAEPVVSKRTTDPPFGDMYEMFSKVAAVAKVMIAIGVSFRDDNLRESVAELLDENPSLSLLILAPVEKEHEQLNSHISEFAKKESVFWIKGYFGDKEINSILTQSVNSLLAEARGQSSGEGRDRVRRILAAWEENKKA